MEGGVGKKRTLLIRCFKGNSHLISQAVCPVSFLSGDVSSFLSSSPPFCLKEPPEQVILELQPAWVAMDEAFTVKCHVPSVAPLENLTLTLLQGNQELHRKNFMSLAVDSQRAEVTIHVKAQREDDRCNFSCRAELDLSSHGGGLFHSSSATKVLRIFGESEPSCGRILRLIFLVLPWPLGLSSHKV